MTELNIQGQYSAERELGLNISYISLISPSEKPLRRDSMRAEQQANHWLAVALIWEAFL